MEYKLILSEYDKYVLEIELNERISKLKYLRDKAGIKVDNAEAEPNKHIQSIEKVLTQLGLEITE